MMNWVIFVFKIDRNSLIRYYKRIRFSERLKFSVIHIIPINIIKPRMLSDFLSISCESDS